MKIGSVFIVIVSCLISNKAISATGDGPIHGEDLIHLDETQNMTTNKDTVVRYKMIESPHTDACRIPENCLGVEQDKQGIEKCLVQYFTKPCKYPQIRVTTDTMGIHMYQLPHDTSSYMPIFSFPSEIFDIQLPKPHTTNGYRVELKGVLYTLPKDNTRREINVVSTNLPSLYIIVKGRNFYRPSIASIPYIGGGQISLLRDPLVIHHTKDPNYISLDLVKGTRYTYALHLSFMMVPTS